MKDAAKWGLGSRGDSVMRQDRNIIVTVWQDKWPVLCPTAIVDYNRYMVGIDKDDQLRKYYNPHMKSRKSYKYIFWFMFEAFVLNAS